MKAIKFILLASTIISAPALAQSEPQGTSATDDDAIIVTGSRIKRDPNNSALPIQIVTTAEITREGLTNPEQLISFLNVNGNGLDNLASNADVVGGAQRGNNGSSSANLRGQGANSTLVLLNGRRVAAHGLNGGTVDVNQIPFSAIERVEILKDGASAIYGADAIGGVINFILRKDYKGFGIQGFADVTEQGGGNIFRASGIAGYGDLQENGFNIMGAVSYSWNKALRGNQRKFVNTFQPDRGLSVDTRGTPFATIVPLAGTAIPNAGASPFVPGSTTIRASGGINVLDLPGQPGCSAIDGQAPYDNVLWEFPQAQFACAWDTGRAAVLQQPLETLTYLARGVARIADDHEISLEVTGSDADSAKRFSNLQITPNTTTQRYAYTRTPGVNTAAFDAVATPLVATFPSLAGPLGTTPSLSYRWRCIECGPREIQTNTKTFRVALGMEGPLFDGWDYRAGFSRATSESQSTLGSGYFFRGTTATGANDANAPIAPGATQPGIIGVLNSGRLNPFLFPGQTQSAEALAMLDAVSAEGVVLYGGKYTLDQLDYSVSGSLFDLPGGAVQIAAGIDYRKEKYKFNGDARTAASRPVIIAAPFDDGNQLAGVSREIKAAYAEALFPIFKGFEITGAVRIDDYDGFGSTTNPKVSGKYNPTDWLMFRGSYSTSFRAPSFNQIFNGFSDAPFTGRDIADPQKCPGGIPNATDPNCASLTTSVNIRNGGKLDLGPETASQYGFGIVIRPNARFSASLDFWNIKRSNTIQILSLRQLIDNFQVFPEAFVRDGAGNLTLIDQRWINAGGTITRGLDLNVRGGGDIAGGQWSAGFDATYLLKKKERVVETQPFGPSQIGVFSFAGDLGLKWKHNAFINFTTGDWKFNVSQIFRNGYLNQELPGVANGTVTPPRLKERVSNYMIHNLAIGYSGLMEGLNLTLGVKNVFDKDPPFAITYDSNFGSGSSWEPRVADPRGRSFTLLAEFKF